MSNIINHNPIPITNFIFNSRWKSIPDCTCQCLVWMWQFKATNLWHDQEEWVGCRGYCFWNIGKNSVQIPLFYIAFSISKFLITLQPDIQLLWDWIKMKHLEVLRKWCKKIGIKIFDLKWLIPLDHVTYILTIDNFQITKIDDDVSL